MCKLLKVLSAFLLFLFLADSASAQGQLYHNQAWRYTPAGVFAASGATVTICSSSGSGLPCTPTLTIYSDSALSHVVANPLAVCTSSPQTGCIDGLGNFSFYMTPGPLTYTITGAGLTSYGPIPDNTSCTAGVTCIATGGPASLSSLTVTGALNANGTNTLANLNTKIFADQQAGATADVKINSCIAAVIAVGGGICDATGLTAVQTIASQVNVGNSSSVPVTLLVPPQANWGVTITNGTSCGLMVFNNSSVINTGIGTGQNASISSASISTNVKGLVCTNDSLGGVTNSFRIEGLAIQNQNLGTMADAAAVLRACKDNSVFRHNLVVNPAGVGLHIGGTTANAACDEWTVEDTWVNGSNGSSSNTTAQPVLIQGSTIGGTTQSGRWYGGSIVQPGSGLNNLLIDGGTSFFVQDISFYGVHMEGTINAADGGTPNVRISHAGPVNFFGGAVFESFANGAYCFRLENSANTLQVSGVECGHTTIVNNAVIGVNAVNTSGGNLSYYSDNQSNFMGGLAFYETTFPATFGTGTDVCYGDSANHGIQCSYNNGAFGFLPLVNHIQTWTAAQTFGAGSSLNFTSLFASPTAPTITGAGCGGTVAAIQNANGTASFEIFTGTAPTSAGCTVTFPAAAHHWICPTITHTSAVSTTNFIILQTGALSSTSVTFQLFSDVAAATAPAASDTWAVSGCYAN